jgi:hypothetical protein
MCSRLDSSGDGREVLDAPDKRFYDSIVMDGLMLARDSGEPMRDIRERQLNGAAPFPTPAISARVAVS